MKKVLTFMILLAVVVSFSSTAAAEDQVKRLSLKDTIYLALKNNLDLQVQKTQLESSRLSLKISKTIYLPTLSASMSYSKSSAPSNQSTDQVAVVETDNTSSNVQIQQLLPYGGTLALGFSVSKNQTNSLNSNFNPNYGAGGGLTFTQPLLKGFGDLATNYNIKIAGLNTRITRLQLEDDVINTIYTVEQAYWELVYAHQSLQARKMALQRSKDLLKQNQIKVKVGTVAPIEVLSSKAEVAANESAVISAERTIQVQEDNLKRILNISKDPHSIIPVDQPEIKRMDLAMESLLIEALENRPDIKRAKLTLKNRNISVKYQKNQALPSLSLRFSYTTSGSGGKYLGNYDDIAHLGIPQNMQGVIDDVFKFKNTDYSVTANFSVPIPFTRQRAEIAQARVNLKQALLQLKSTQNTIYSEVKGITKELQTNLKLVDADKIAVELAEQNLKAEEKRLAVGLVTNFNVLEYQRRFTEAQTGALRSRIDYTLTLARLNRILNRTFKVYDINFATISE